MAQLSALCNPSQSVSVRLDEDLFALRSLMFQSTSSEPRTRSQISGTLAEHVVKQQVAEVKVLLEVIRDGLRQVFAGTVPGLHLIQEPRCRG